MDSFWLLVSIKIPRKTIPFSFPSLPPTWRLLNKTWCSQSQNWSHPHCPPGRSAEPLPGPSAPRFQMDSLSLLFGGEEPRRGNRSLFLRHCKGHLREEEEAETSCEAFQPVSRLELFYLLNSLPAEQFSAGEQRQCREGIFPQGLNALTVPGPKPVLSGAAWWFHGETRGLKQENRVVLLRHSSAHFASISHMVLSACYVLGIMLYSRDKQEEAPSLQCLPFYRVYRGVTLGMNSQ